MHPDSRRAKRKRRQDVRLSDADLIHKLMKGQREKKYKEKKEKKEREKERKKERKKERIFLIH